MKTQSHVLFSMFVFVFFFFIQTTEWNMKMNMHIKCNVTSNHKYKSHLVSKMFSLFFFFFKQSEVLNTEEHEPFPPFSRLQKKRWHRQDRTCTESHGCPWYHVGSCFRSNNMKYQRCNTRRTVLTGDSMWDESLINFSVNRENMECKSWHACTLSVPLLPVF